MARRKEKTAAKGQEKSAEAEREMAKCVRKAKVSAEMQSIISSMQKGATLTKVRSAGRRYRRYFYVDTTALTLNYSGSKKCVKRLDQSCIPIKHIAEVREEAQSPVHAQKNAGVVPSFTVVVGEQVRQTV